MINRLISALSLLGIISAVPYAACAADASADRGAQLEEVVVTAQKRVENLQQVPISAQVISSQMLTAQNHNTLEELTQVLPDVHVSTGQQSNVLYIRGTGSGDDAFFDQSVATFVDDIYRGRSRLSAASFLDLERIEVLKGPQSTYFGNNAIAGALNILTKKPTRQFEAWARVLYGMFGQYAAEGAVSGPITDTLGARLAVTKNGILDGWLENVNLGHNVPRINNLAGRLTLGFTPNEALDATLKIEASKHATSGTAYDEPTQWANCPPPAPYPVTFGPFGACAQALALGPSIPRGLDNRKTDGLPGQRNDLSTFEDVLTVNYRKWGQTFTSVSGFYNYHFEARVDPLNLPVWLDTVQWPEKYHQISQELRVASSTGGALEYLAGVYFQTDELSSSIVGTFPILNPLLGALAPYLPVSLSVPSSQGEHVYSTFGSLTWNATESLKFTAGLRGSWVYKNLTGSREYGYVPGGQFYGGFVPDPAPIQSVLSFLLGAPGTQNTIRSDHDWMPSARVQYQIDPAAMAYFSFNRGFKAGGINGFSPVGTIENTQFGPEHVNAYELGIKSKWLDDSVLLNLDVFRSNYTGLQVSAQVYNATTGAYAPEIRNAANSRSQGVEFEGQWAISRDFRLSTNVTYLDSYYLKFPNASQTSLQTYCGTLNFAAYSATAQCASIAFPVAPFDDLSGKPTPYAPRWSGSLTASYTVPLPAGYSLSTVLMPYATSSYHTLSPDDPFYRVPAYVRLDGRLTLESPDHRWSVDLIGKNLTDRSIIENPNPTNSPYTVILQPRRSAALQFNYHL
jgi:outer membrane receptor protein involved in Fe transport